MDVFKQKHFETRAILIRISPVDDFLRIRVLLQVYFQKSLLFRTMKSIEQKTNRSDSGGSDTTGTRFHSHFLTDEFDEPLIDNNIIGDNQKLIELINQNQILCIQVI